jgi:hypothetical protein
LYSPGLSVQGKLVIANPLDGCTVTTPSAAVAGQAFVILARLDKDSTCTPLEQVRARTHPHPLLPHAHASTNNLPHVSQDDLHVPTRSSQPAFAPADFWVLWSWRLQHSLTRSLAHSCTRSITCSPNHALARSLAHLLTYSLTHSHTHSLDHSLIHSLTHTHDRRCLRSSREHRASSTWHPCELRSSTFSRRPVVRSLRMPQTQQFLRCVVDRVRAAVGSRTVSTRARACVCVA